MLAVGSGQALEIGRRGDADALLVHDRQAEEALVDASYAEERRDVMDNHFVVIGPAADPADVRGAESVIDALRRIAEQQAVFVSRGDDSGTHRAERRFWGDTEVTPGGPWYRELGSGMGQTLNTAAAMDAYVLSDRATWATFENRQRLQVLYEGDDELVNQYGSILLSKAQHPHLRHDKARQWHAWLTSEDGQRAIAQYTVGGEQLFVPNAR
ncbi:substrate-binding domain-containing protein [Aquisalimonas sp.]|uniref:substrate-binding domain-containing protein n=1 Tax=Aquisalimonas sp. TaxID=1872621 RepID=UPI0025C3253C|nr:substrate-binding domain-containing protein [Aquisalimonas sp.]